MYARMDRAFCDCIFALHATARSWDDSFTHALVTETQNTSCLTTRLIRQPRMFRPPFEGHKISPFRGLFNIQAR